MGASQNEDRMRSSREGVPHKMSCGVRADTVSSEKRTQAIVFCVKLSGTQAFYSLLWASSLLTNVSLSSVLLMAEKKLDKPTRRK